MKKGGSNDKYQCGNLILKETQTEGALVLGDCNSAIDNHILKPHKIRTIVSIGKEAAPPPQKVLQQTVLKCYDVHDNKSQKIIQLLDQIYQVIEHSRMKGGVLVHCYAGVSRSSSFVIGYIMRKSHINYDDAKALVKKQRSCIYPNDVFVRQLQTYWKILLKRQEERLSKFRQPEKVEQKEQEEQKEQVEVSSPNISTVTNRTVRGVRGAVKGAQRSPSLEKRQHKSSSIPKQGTQFKSGQLKMREEVGFSHSQKIELLAKKEAHLASELLELLPITTEQQKTEQKQMKKKDVKGVYGTKTKVK